MIVKGEVTGGNKIGRCLGFPTANITVPDDLHAEDGVYAARVTVGEETYPAMAFLGRKPTVGGGCGPRILEANLFGFEGDLYGRHIEVELGEYVRPSRHFDSFDELKTQICSDKNKIIKG